MNETTVVLVLYDLTGRVWGIYGGETEVPPGVLGFLTEVDAKRSIESISLDMTTTPPTPTVVYMRETADIDSDVTDTQLAILELDARVSALEG